MTREKISVCFFSFCRPFFNIFLYFSLRRFGFYHYYIQLERRSFQHFLSLFSLLVFNNKNVVVALTKNERVHSSVT